MTNEKQFTQFCSIDECARRSGLSRRFVRQAAKAGRIPVLMSGEKYIIDYPGAMSALAAAAAAGGNRDAEQKP